MCQALRRTKSGPCLVKIQSTCFFPPESGVAAAKFWQKSGSLVCKLPQVLNVRALIIWELEQGFRAERRWRKWREEIFSIFLWSFLVFLWTCYVFRQTVRKSNSSLSSCCFYEKLCGYEETILVPGYSVSEAYEVGKTGWLGIKKTFQHSENQKGLAMGITWAYQTSFAQVPSDSTPCEDLRGTFRHQKGSAG